MAAVQPLNSILPPLPASAEIYAGINDIDVLLHRLFELRRRVKLYQAENALLSAELAKRLTADSQVRTARYRAMLSVHTVKQFTVPGGVRTQVFIQRLEDVGGAK